MKTIMESILILSQVYFFAKSVRNTRSNAPLIVSCFGIMATAILLRYYM